jgi:hypothetical protein
MFFFFFFFFFRIKIKEGQCQMDGGWNFSLNLFYLLEYDNGEAPIISVTIVIWCPVQVFLHIV